MSRTIKKLMLLWLTVFVVASVFLSRTNYVSTSNDSRFYSEQVGKYYDRSWSEIITPKWGNNYGFNPDSYMRDQFPGQMVIGVIGAKLGIPAKHSLHIIEMFFQVGSIFFLFFIANHFIWESEASFLLFGLLLVSNAFSYNIRGNHENGLTFFSLWALWAGLSFTKNYFSKGIQTIFSIFMLLFIKGPFLIFGFCYFVIGFLANYYFYDKSDFKVKFFKAFLVLILAMLVSVGFVIGFEKLFLSITGESFLNEFYRLQFKERALEVSNQHFFIVQKILNFIYYVNRCIVYSLPWSLIAIIILISKLFNKTKIEFLKSPLSIVLLLATLSYCAVFATSNRIAGRYAYPAYYTSAAWMIMFCYFNIEKMKEYRLKIGENIFILIILFFWLIAFIIPFIKNPSFI